MSNKIKPFIKWAGGKRKIAPKIYDIYINYFNEFKNYHEPFIGGGAMLFYLKPKSKVFINDINSELIKTYMTIKNNHEELLRTLVSLENKNNKITFENIKNFNYFKQVNDINSAARLLFLNKTSHSGLYRVNKKNQFNVPYKENEKGKLLNFNYENIELVSKYLREANAEITNNDFYDTLENIKKDDLVYLDPPYFPIDGKNSFDMYDVNMIGKSIIDKMNEQIRIKKFCDKALRKGAKVIISNSYNQFIFDLYSNKIKRAANTRYKYYIHEVNATRSINSDSLKRSSKFHKEYVIIGVKNEVSTSK